MPHPSQPSARKSIRALLFRLMGAFAIRACTRVPAFALAAGGGLFLAALFLEWALAGMPAAVVGRWTTTIALTSVGVALGSFAGLAAAAQAALQATASDLRSWLSAVPAAEGDQQFSPIDLEQLRSRYEETVGRVCESVFNSIPLPRILLWPFEAHLRRVLGEGLLSEWPSHDVATITDMRSFVLDRLFRFMIDQLQWQLRCITAACAGLVFAVAVVVVLFALLGNRVPAPWLISSTLGIMGAVVLGLGLPRAAHFPSPWKYRQGILLLATGLAVWPLVWMQLWDLDLGMVWIVVWAATAAMFLHAMKLVLIQELSGNGHIALGSHSTLRSP